MYAKVIPAVRSIRGKDEFVYRVDDSIDLKVGSVVLIPWRKDRILGVIWECDLPKPSFNTKDIIEVIDIALSDSYMAWIAWFASFYFVSKSHVIKMALPSLLKRKLKENPPKKKDLPKLAVQKNRVPEIQAALTRVIDMTGKKYVLQYSNVEEVMAVVGGLLKKNNSVTILIAEDIEVESWVNALSFYAPIIVSSKLNKTALNKAWRSIIGSKNRLYIGTKRLSLLPLEKMDYVIIIDPEKPSHKQWDLNPRYWVPRVVAHQVENTDARILHLTQSPTVEDYIACDVDIQLSTSLNPPNTVLIDMSSERFEDGQALLSRTVLDNCENAAAPFLWFNRKGSETFFICATCDEWIGDVSAKQCNKCKGINLTKRGQGTKALRELLQVKFPNRQIIEITKDASVQDINYSIQPILIGTQYAENIIDWSKIDYTVVVSIDNILSQPDFGICERTLHKLVHLRNRAKKLYIQTYVPQHTVFQALLENVSTKWYEEEIKSRQAFKQPPFGFRAVLINTQTKEEKVITAMKDLPDDPDWIVDREL